MNGPMGKTVILDHGTAEQKRDELRNYFINTYVLDECLYRTLVNDEAFYYRAEPLRHPLIFYYGHTSAFCINKLLLSKIIDYRVNPHFESMFAIGVDEMSWDDINDSSYEWPSVSEVRQYRESVREIVLTLIDEFPFKMPITWDSPLWVFLMCIEHQRIHIETSSVIIRRLPIDMVSPSRDWEICRNWDDEPPENKLISVAGRKITIGKPRNHPLYGWDNEYGHHEYEVWNFQASKYLVSNREYASFVDDSGYETQEYWTEEGWRWVTFTKSKYPLFWIKTKGEYLLRTMLENIKMPWNWPVEVNYLEAKAFCNYVSKKNGVKLRLPTEEEWYSLRNLNDIPDQPYWPEAPGNINLEYWASPCPVDHFKQGDFYDIIGNLWQWTETPITGFHGFKVHPYYDDFSTPTFDTQHNLIKGGSWISTGNEATYHARYAFRRHFYQHAGFRYVTSKQSVPVFKNNYETDRNVSQYCEAHYGDIYFGVENFPKKCASLCLELCAGRAKKKALDIGCAVGRTTFELAREFEFVNGLDFSARFIRIAIQLQEKGVLRYNRIEEGEIVSYHDKHLSECSLDHTVGKVQFFQGDASNLKPQFTDYDLVFAGNVLDRLYDPQKFLTTIHERITERGLLVIASPYTWLETYTKKDKWLGGFRKDGEPFSTLDGLKRSLSKHFKMIEEPRDIEFVIRETNRSFQHTLSQLTLWEKVR